MFKVRPSRGQLFSKYSAFLRVSGLPETEIGTKAGSLSSNPRIYSGMPKG